MLPARQCSTGGGLVDFNTHSTAARVILCWWKCAGLCVCVAGSGDATQVGREERWCGNRQRAGASAEEHSPRRHYSQVYSLRWTSHGWLRETSGHGTTWFVTTNTAAAGAHIATKLHQFLIVVFYYCADTSKQTHGWTGLKAIPCFMGLQGNKNYKEDKYVKYILLFLDQAAWVISQHSLVFLF